ncbi:MAG TPA: proline--tRNA ligase [Acidimicrobiales bacterium]|jgi:prolyl-tRNA synthetase|nr:proline--tRNA ligase [Acidimicrobiales bacterium]
MRMSRLLVRTLREAPADAEVASAQLLIRGGYIRRLASGVYTFLPLGYRVLQKLERVIRQELDASGGQEMLMPALHPIELWEQSGRAAMFGTDNLPAMVVDGRGGTFVLGPTHEEVATVTVGAEVDSYRQLPLTIYQIQVKFRDEARPRFGLLRTRELIMADAYSFDVDMEALQTSYAAVFEAYLRIFARLDLDVFPVVARSGAIGGDVNHEFMVPSAVGEDHFVQCAACGYAANVEAAERRVDPDPAGQDGTGVDADHPPLVTHHTPDRPGIELVVAFFAAAGGVPGDERVVTSADMMKCLAVIDDQGRPTLMLVPGDREARLPSGWRLFDDDDFAAHPSLIKGYIGPMGQQEHGIRVVADHSIGRGGTWMTGANQRDHHVSGLRLGRDFTVDEWGSFVEVVTGDRCPHCGEPIGLVRSVEAAHTFQLGRRYSDLLPGSNFVAEDGTDGRFSMGCYGMGVSRLLAVVAEEHHDDKGLIWPEEVAPYRVALLALGAGRSPEVAAAAEELYAGLVAAGVEVLYDDRDASPGVKFKDADLLGLPVRLVVGAKGLARGVVEWQSRATGEDRELAPGDVVAELVSS